MSGGISGDLPPPDYATVVIEADRRRHEAEEDGEDDIYLEPRDALHNFQLRPTASSLVTTEIGSFSLDLGKFFLLSFTVILKLYAILDFEELPV